MFREGPVMFCDAAQFNTRNLIEALAPSLLSTDAGTLIVTGVETFSPAQQKILENLMTGRDVFLPFARRFRLVLAAAASLSELADDGRFNDTLYYKISSLSVTVPSLRELREDVAANAVQLLADHRIALNASAAFTLSAPAAAWLRAQEWPGNYAQLSRVLLTAAREVRAGEIDVPALEAGLRDDTKNSAAVKPAPAVSPPTVTPTPVKQGHATVIALEPSPATAVTAHSVFRPATRTYDFGQRLATSLATAGVALAY
jgi:DNA-binding NtrC family response regulator